MNNQQQNKLFEEYLQNISALRRTFDEKKDSEAHRNFGISHKENMVVLSAPFDELNTYFMKRCNYGPFGIMEDLELISLADDFHNAGIPTERRRVFENRIIDIKLNYPVSLFCFNVKGKELTKLKEKMTDYNVSVSFWRNENNSEDKWYVCETISNEIINLCNFGIHHHYRMCLPVAKPQPVYYNSVPKN